MDRRGCRSPWHRTGDSDESSRNGARSRQAILKAATELASIEGLDGLSIARLAEHVGMSKSGLFAHFKSKEDLQIATINAATEIFDREVTQPGLAAAPGVPRILAVCDAYFSHLERRAFPGGCFFVSVAAEFDAKAEGRVKAHVREIYSGILQQLGDLVREAQTRGEIDRGEDVAQLVFEIDAFLVGAHFGFVFFGATALDRARTAVRRRLARAEPIEATDQRPGTGTRAPRVTKRRG